MLVTCAQCSKTLKVPDNVAGKKIRCPSCSGIVDVPAGSGTSPQAPPSPPPASPPAAPPPAASPPAAPPPAAPRVARPVSSGGSSSPAAPRSTDGPSDRSRSAERPSSARPASTGRSSSSRPSSGGARSDSRPPAKGRRKPAPAEEYDDYDNDEGGNDDFGYDGSYGGYDANPFAAPSARGSHSVSHSRASEASGKSLTRIGLLIQGWSFVFVFTSLLGLIGITFLARWTVGGPPRALAYLGLLVFLGNFVALIAILVGQCLCLAIPSRSGAKGWIIGAISFLVAMVVLFFMLGVSGNLMSSGFMNVGLIGMIRGIAILWLLTPLGYTICFHIFLRQASLYVGRDDLGTQALIVLIGPPVTGVLHTVTIFLIGMIARSMDPVVLGVMVIVLSLFFLIAYVVFAVMHVALLFRLGAAMR